MKFFSFLITPVVSLVCLTSCNEAQTTNKNDLALISYVSQAEEDANEGFYVIKKEMLTNDIIDHTFKSIEFIHLDAKKLAKKIENEDDAKKIEETGNSVEYFYTFEDKDGTAYFGTGTYSVKGKKANYIVAPSKVTAFDAEAATKAAWDNAVKAVDDSYQTIGILTPKIGAEGEILEGFFGIQHVMIAEHGINIAKYKYIEFIYTDAEKLAMKAEDEDAAKKIEEIGNNITYFYSFEDKLGTAYFGKSTYDIKNKEKTYVVLPSKVAGKDTEIFAKAEWDENVKAIDDSYQIVGKIILNNMTE